LESQLRENLEHSESLGNEKDDQIKSLQEKISGLQTELQLRTQKLEVQTKQCKITQPELEMKLISETKLHEVLGSLKSKTLS